MEDKEFEKMYYESLLENWDLMVELAKPDHIVPSKKIETIKEYRKLVGDEIANKFLKKIKIEN